SAGQVAATVATVFANLSPAERRQLIDVLAGEPAATTHARVKALVLAHAGRRAKPAPEAEAPADDTARLWRTFSRLMAGAAGRT
ncbi:MAG TPA: hypothetical protein VGQ80_18970, partial [Acidimicrobiia bacterium]|nr:hypothetical protein [Acidimicrobiia bacterium]